MKSYFLFMLALLTDARVLGRGSVVPNANFFKPALTPSWKIPTAPPDFFGSFGYPMFPTNINPISPVADLEGRIFSKLEVIMTPIKIYFNENNPKFSQWDRSVDLIMPENMKRDIVAETYRLQPQSDRELENFWGQIMGELLARGLVGIRGNIAALEDAINVETSKGTPNYELKELENRRIDGYSEFSGTAKLVIDSLGLGVDNYDSEMYMDVIRPFLDALVAFKALRHKMNEVI